MKIIRKRMLVSLITLVLILAGGIYVHADVNNLEKALICTNDSSPRVRCQAVYCLGEKGDPACVQPLLERLSDRDRHVRRIAAHALGKLNDLRAVMPLIAVLQDNNQPVCVRSSAAFALGRLGDPRASQVLRQFVKGEHGWLETAALKGLNRLGETGTQTQ